MIDGSWNLKKYALGSYLLPYISETISPVLTLRVSFLSSVVQIFDLLTKMVNNDLSLWMVMACGSESCTDGAF